MFEKNFTGSSWKRILLEIYRFAPNQYGESSKMGVSDDRHELAKELKITGHELMLGISFMTDQGLIERNINPRTESMPYSATFVLTPKGFDVALKLVEHNTSNRVQVLISLLTAMLVINGMVEIMNPMTPQKGILLLIYVIAIVCVYFIGTIVFKDFR